MHHVPPKRSPFFKPALTQWPLVIGLCFATHRPPIFCHSKTSNFWFVTQRPPISDFVTQKPIISIIYLAQTLISHNNWSQDFKGFIACGQLDVLYSIFGLKEDPHFTTLSLKDPIIFDLPLKDTLFFGCSCHRKTPMSEVLAGTCTSLWYMSAPALGNKRNPSEFSTVELYHNNVVKKCTFSICYVGVRS